MEDGRLRPWPPLSLPQCHQVVVVRPRQAPCDKQPESLTARYACASIATIPLLSTRGQLLVTRRLVIGYTLTFAAALFWIVTSILDRVHVLAATAVYHDSTLAQIMAYAFLGLAIVIVIMSFVTPLTVNYGNGRQRRR